MGIFKTLTFTLSLGLFAPACLWAESVELYDNPCEEALWMLHQKIEDNRFFTDRLALDYERQSSGLLSEALKRIPKDGHWVDAGAGEAKAQLEYLGVWKPLPRKLSPNFELRAEKGFRATAISYKLPRTEFTEKIWKKNLKRAGFNYIQGSYIENVPAGSIESADLITDVYGPLAYTTDFTKVLKTYFDLLNDDGELIFINTIGYNKVVDGEEILTLEDWMMKNYAFCGLERRSRYDYFRILEEYKLSAFRWTKKDMKKCDLPRLQLVDLKTAGPPYRLFRVVR